MLANNSYIVMTYNVISQEWSQLPQYTAHRFAMTVIHNKLTLVGGRDHNLRDTNVLGCGIPMGGSGHTPTLLCVHHVIHLQ